jgi:hypothetical protein
LRFQDLDAEFGGSLRNWTGGQLLAAATWGIWPGDDSDKLVAGIGQSIQRRDRDIGYGPGMQLGFFGISNG